MTATYDSIATTTLTSAQTSVTFSNISQNFTDLVLVCTIRDTNTGTQRYPFIRFNGDSNTNYSWTRMHGNEGNQAVSARASNQTSLSYEAPGAGSTANYFAPSIFSIQNYSNTTTNKTAILRSGNFGGAVQVAAIVGLYRSTSAITSISITADTSFATSSSFTIYGIKAE